VLEALRSRAFLFFLSLVNVFISLF
jgi:hypothetical protein